VPQKTRRDEPRTPTVLRDPQTRRYAGTKVQCCPECRGVATVAGFERPNYTFRGV